jgi:hypothetical protein
VIVFAPNPWGPLSRVSAAGGEPVPVTRLDTTRGDYSHRFPRFLPDGKRFIYLAKIAKQESAVVLGSLDGGESRELLRSPAMAELAAGHLLYFQGSSLMARPFDATRIEFSGKAFRVAEDASLHKAVGHGVLSACGDDLLVYGTVDEPICLQRVSRDGSQRRSLGEPAEIWTVSRSPVAPLAALSIVGDHGRDLWLHDLDRDVRTRLTSESNHEFVGVWSPDGRRLAFRGESDPPGIRQLRLLGGREEEVLLVGEFEQTACNPTGYSPDGRLLAYEQLGPGTDLDIWVLPLDDVGAPYPIVQTRFAEGSGVFSPDGRWLAYASNESGQWEVYVTPFPGPGGKWQVSSAGGLYPSWRSDGREIIYQDALGQVVAVAVAAGDGTFELGAADALFEVAPSAPPGHGGVVNFAASSDAQDFVVVSKLAVERPRAFSLLTNWTALRDER